jgi:predicted secreted protein
MAALSRDSPVPSFCGMDMQLAIDNNSTDSKEANAGLRKLMINFHKRKAV